MKPQRQGPNSYPLATAIGCLFVLCMAFWVVLGITLLLTQ